MNSKFDNVCNLTNTANDQVVEVEVDNFRLEESFDAYIATNKIPASTTSTTKLCHTITKITVQITMNTCF